MRKHPFLTLFLLFVNAGQVLAQFIPPLEGVYLRDFYIVNYPDEDSSDSIMETYCGSKTYNGHKGTDFTLRNFRQMDSGVYAVAAADGIVFKVVEDKFDRNKSSDTSLGYGNYVGIWHVINGVNYYTYYAHLRTNSVTVDSGQIVTAGQRLGLVGSSGNATDPHVHFEVWNDTTWLDPFKGNCTTMHNRNLWIQPLDYDTILRTINHGLTNKYPILDNLRESPVKVSTYTNISDSFISYWWQGTGIRKNDSIAIVWRTSQDSVWDVFNYVSTRDYWYGYFYAYIFNPYLIKNNPPAGEWTARFFVNNKFVCESVFNLSPSSALENIFTKNYTLKNNGIVFSEGMLLACTDMLGREIPFDQKETTKGIEYSPRHKGLLVYRISFHDKIYNLKVIVNE